MKRIRLIIYGFLLVILSMGIVYIAKKELVPNGRSAGVRIYKGADPDILEKIDPALGEVLSKTTPEQIVDFVVWLKVPEDFNTPLYTYAEDYFGKPIKELVVTDEIAKEEIERFLDDNYQNKTEILKYTNEKFRWIMDGLINSFPDTSYEISETLPVVFISGNKDLVLELARPELEEVDRIYRMPVFELAMDTVREAVGRPAGVSGGGVKVAVIELYDDVKRIPALEGGTHPIEITKGAGGLGDHATRVASVIRSVDNTYTGIAPDVKLWTTSFDKSTDFIKCIDSAVKWEARAINLSIVSLYSQGISPKGKFYLDMSSRICDATVFNYGISVVCAAGNENNDSKRRVPNPAIAYNVIAVGNYKDKQEYKTLHHAIDNTSNWVDPHSQNGDRELPNVCAPGTVSVPGKKENTFITTSGTSFAAPVVTGEVAILVEVNPFLQLFPQAVKAIVMASAVDDVKGGSDKVGVGGIRIDHAVDIAKKSSGGWGVIGMQKPEGNYKPSVTKVVDLYGNRKVRVAISWLTAASYSSSSFDTYEQKPTADINLYVYEFNPNKPGGKGKLIAKSASKDNTDEYVEFTPKLSGGKYDIELKAERIDNPIGVAVGWAVWQEPLLQVKQLQPLGVEMGHGKIKTSRF